MSLGFRGQVDTALAILSFLILLGMSAAAVLKVVAARQREAQRHYTIEGLPGAMLEVDWPLGTPDNDSASAEIAIEWPDSRAARINGVITFVIGAGGIIYV
jgi:hypothetical protein